MAARGLACAMASMSLRTPQHAQARSGLQHAEQSYVSCPLTFCWFALPERGTRTEARVGFRRLRRVTSGNVRRFQRDGAACVPDRRCSRVTLLHRCGTTWLRCVGCFSLKSPPTGLLLSLGQQQVLSIHLIHANLNQQKLVCGQALATCLAGAQAGRIEVCAVECKLKTRKASPHCSLPLLWTCQYMAACL